MKKIWIILLCTLATLSLLWLFAERSTLPDPSPETTWEEESPTEPDTQGEEENTSAPADA